MAYNRYNLLLKYRQIQEETQKHYVPDITTYAGIYRMHILPKWPMSYNTYMKIVNTNVARELKEYDDKGQYINKSNTI